MKFKVGDRVKSEKFGEGTVVETGIGPYEDQVLVQFDKSDLSLHNGNMFSKNGPYKNYTCWYYLEDDTDALKLIKKEEERKMKFKVGDRVRFINSLMFHTDIVKIGEFYKITEVDNTGAPYRIKNGEWFKEEELELAKKEFTKLDLKDGDKCTLKNGKVLFYGGNKEYENSYSFSSLKNDLRFEYNDEVSIIKVERPTRYETVFERKEEILDKVEKEYLKQVIRPFRNKVRFIEKHNAYKGQSQFIEIALTNCDFAQLPNFKKDTMYKNLVSGKKYTLKELEL